MTFPEFLNKLLSISFSCFYEKSVCKNSKKSPRSHFSSKKIQSKKSYNKTIDAFLRLTSGFVNPQVMYTFALPRLTSLARFDKSKACCTNMVTFKMGFDTKKFVSVT